MTDYPWTVTVEDEESIVIISPQVLVCPTSASAREIVSRVSSLDVKGAFVTTLDLFTYNTANSRSTPLTV